MKIVIANVVPYVFTFTFETKKMENPLFEIHFDKVYRISSFLCHNIHSKAIDS